MSRRVQFRATTDQPLDRLYAATVDPDVLRSRLKRIGGPGAELLEHTANGEGAHYRVRHGLDESQLPSLVKTFLGGKAIRIDREESWRRTAEGYGGDVRVGVPGLPAGADGTMFLVPHDQGSEFGVDLDVSVPVPVIGAKVEQSVGEQIKQLLAMELDYTLSTL